MWNVFERKVSLNKRYHTNFQVIESNIPPKNNRSGYKGVWWDERRQKWVAYLSIHGKRLHLGRYRKLEDAVKARHRAEDEYYLPLIQQKTAEEVSDD